METLTQNRLPSLRQGLHLCPPVDHLQRVRLGLRVYLHQLHLLYHLPCLVGISVPKRVPIWLSVKECFGESINITEQKSVIISIGKPIEISEWLPVSITITIILGFSIA